MFLRYRVVGVADLPECLRCIRDLFAYSEEEKVELLAMWKEVITTGQMFAGALEDITAEPGKRIVWFCTQACIPDEYAHYLQNEAPPFLGKKILNSWKRGELPLLTAEQMRKANTPGGGGVNLIAVNSGSPPEILNGPGWNEVAGKLVGFTEYFATGYQTKLVLEEFYDPFTYAMIEGAGFLPKNDYVEYYASNDLPLPPENQRPRLYGVNKEESNISSATLAHMIFAYKPPRFFFKSTEQELLLHALLGETDEELAQILFLSPNTLKKRWQSIYSRVEMVAPEILGRPTDRENDTKRGAEKKRNVMEYIRHHLEEVRPVMPQTTP